MAGSNQTAIFNFKSRGNIPACVTADRYPFNFTASQTAGKFSAIHPVGFTCPLFVFRRHIGRIYYHIVNTMLLQLVVYPKTTVSCLIDRIICSSRKIVTQIVDKHFNLRRLRKGLMFKLFGKYTYAPPLFMNIHTYINLCHINLLTTKIKSVKMIHASLLSIMVTCLCNGRQVCFKEYNLKGRLASLLFNHKVCG